MKKRSDLQGIRGMAIFSVLLFHFFPETFKNGYVGVDQFFILSGFLMAEILSRDSSLSISGLFSFYYRRMKRILPLYALFILSTLLFSIIIFPFSTFTYNIPHSIRSLAFISNTKQEDETQSYEKMISQAENLFTHTWSLSCEVQFYLMAPFLILTPKFFPQKVFISLCIICSFFLMIYCFNTDAQYFAFNSVFTRIWQFSLGILCSHLQRKSKRGLTDEILVFEAEKAERHKTVTLSSPFNLLIFSVLLLSWYPLILIPDHLIRLLVCCQTAGLIYSGQFFPNIFLSNRFVVYLGDTSYSLYLIHWPIYVYLKFNQLNSVTEHFIAMAISILLAGIVHETFERFYLKLEKKGIYSLTFTLYLACFVILAPNLDFKFSDSILPAAGVKKLLGKDTPYFQLPENLTLESAIKLNEHLSKIDLGLLDMKECTYNKFKPDENGPWTMCRTNNTEYSGSKRLMFVGNSYSPMIGRMFIHLIECQEKAADIYIYTRIACEVLENTKNGECKGNVTNRYYEAVKEIKPDILFITDRHQDSMEAANGPVDNHLETEKGYLAQIEKEVKQKVYILNALPRPMFSPQYTTILNDGLRIRGKTDHSKLTDTSASYQIARDRMSQLAKICSKCELIDPMPSFTKNGVFQMYDESTNVQYFTNPLHFSEYGLQTVSPVYRNICKKL